MSAELDGVYALLDGMSRRSGGPRRLSDCRGGTGWPGRGVYFFLDEAETRPDGSPRVVRVGTHALREGSATTLWGRLSQHRGTVAGRNPGGGNHRGSVFRLHVGQALLARDGGEEAVSSSWSRGSNAPADVRQGESSHERRVSAHIGSLPFLWLDVDDDPGPGSERGLIERTTIAVLGTAAVDEPASPTWLGRWSPNAAIRSSGLWNVNHVGERPSLEGLRVIDRFTSELDRLRA